MDSLTVTIADGRVLYVGPGLELRPHRAGAAVVVVGLEQPFTLTVEDAVCTARAAVIAPGVLHHLDTAGRMAFLYVDPVSDDLAALPRAPDVPAIRRAVGGGPGEGTVARVAAALGLPRRSRGRLWATLACIDANPDAFSGLSEAAAHAGLSPSRFRHVLRDETGLTFRAFRRWRRFAAVAVALQGGASLTEAALAAGFAGSAHFSTAFSDLFGLAPSRLLKGGAKFCVPDASRTTS